LICSLVIDSSASMDFGANGSKLEYVQFLATALSEVISRQQDQVGLALVSGGLDSFLPPGSTATHITQLQELIATIRPRPVTDLAASLQALFQRLPRRGVLLLMSDFLVDPLEAVFTALRLFRHRRWEVILLHVVHPSEE